MTRRRSEIDDLLIRWGCYLIGASMIGGLLYLFFRGMDL